MQNLDEKTATKESQPITVDSPRLKWLLITVAGVLAISIALNLFLFYFEIAQEKTFTEQSSGGSTILSNTHKIDKEISNNGITWVGIKTTQSNEMVAANYEFWRISGNNEKFLIDNFSVYIGQCDNISWNVNKDGGIDLVYMTSPCEAFDIKTNINYDPQGVEQFRISHNSSAGNFTFKQYGRPEYEVSLDVNGTCEGFVTLSPENFSMPEVLLRGVKLTTFQEKKEFPLIKPEKIACQAGYSDTIIGPIINNPTFNGEKIEFTLPNEQKAIISLEPANYGKVEFK